MAGRIPESTINEVRNAVNIVDIVSQYVSLTKKGKDYVGLCPFHQEKTPSFTVNEQNQFFKCFGCGKGGNVFKFLMYKENLTFPESVRQVAEFANIKLADAGPAAPISPLRRMYQEASEFYHHILVATELGARGRRYAKGRELSDDLIDHFHIGYAPDNDQLLLTYLRNKHYEENDLQESGLFVQAQNGQLFDRFRDRLMFPLGDEHGQPVAFSGRRLSQDKTVAKYMNSPETKIFKKSRLLFHFAEARKAARREGHLVLYEGYMDVIAAYRAGVHSGVASMGTSLTQEQVYMLRRVTPNVIINYDGDDPGVHAAGRAARMFQAAGRFNLGIVILPEKLDPDEYVKKYGADKYQGQVKAAQSPTDFFIGRYASQYDLDNDREQLAFIDQAVAEIARLADPVAEDVFLNKLAKQTGVSHDALSVKLMQARRKQRRVRANSGLPSAETHENVPLAEVEEAARPQQRSHPIQDRLLYLFINFDDARDYLLEKQFLFPDEQYAQLAEDWLRYQETHDEPNLKDFADYVPSDLQGIIVNIAMQQWPTDFSDAELSQALTRLTQLSIDKKIGRLQQELAQAKQRQDGDDQVKIIDQILALKKRRDLGRRPVDDQQD